MSGTFLPMHAPAMAPSLQAAFFKRELRRKAKRLDTLDHFAVLGVERLATRHEIETAFDFLMRWFDPDRTSSLGIPALRPIAQRICERLRQACDTLIDPDFRAAYEMTLNMQKRTSRSGRVRRREQTGQSPCEHGSVAPSHYAT